MIEIFEAITNFTTKQCTHVLCVTLLASGVLTDFFKFSSLYNIEQYARTLNEQKIEEEKLGDLKTIFQSTNNFCLIKSYFKINTKKINARFFEEIILTKKLIT